VKKGFDPIAAVPGGNGVEDGGREEPKEINHFQKRRKVGSPINFALLIELFSSNSEPIV
jgi:hypothetical protein